jgi:hypothetical protein
VTGRRPRAAVVALAVTSVLAAGGCGLVGDDDGVDREQANAALEQQRSDARALARVLLDGAEQALPGATSPIDVGGQWRGCDSASLEEFRNFRYQLSARVDLAPSAGVGEPYLAPLHPVMEDAGLDAEQVEEPNGFTALRGQQGGLTVQFVHTGAGRFVLLEVVGECVDVAEEDRDYWLRRDEPSPALD